MRCPWGASQDNRLKGHFPRNVARIHLVSDRKIGHRRSSKGLNLGRRTKSEEFTPSSDCPDGPRNMALVQRIALNLIKHRPSGKDSLTVKRKKAGWSVSYLIETITGTAD
jgi:hypothetical protein